jgi:hypothetical protein
VPSSSGQPFSNGPSSSGDPFTNGPSSSGGPGSPVSSDPTGPSPGAGVSVLPGSVPPLSGPPGTVPGDPSGLRDPDSLSLGPDGTPTEGARILTPASTENVSNPQAVVPEPSSMALLALALCAGAARRYRTACRRP